ncbi:MAG: Crp/Fnr family transcriptional regulator [Nocardioidaceae bacterium]
MTEPARTELLSRTRQRKFARREVLFHEGDPGDSLLLIESGRLAVQVNAPSGETVTLNVLSSGDYFGELALLRDEPSHRRTATVVALEPAMTLSISGATFQSVCMDHPQVERLVSRLLAERVEQLSQRLLEALYVGADMRVYRRLVELAEVYGACPHGEIPLTQEQLADLAGATRPTVNQVLQRLAAQGFVGLHRGRIEVLDLASIQRRARL